MRELPSLFYEADSASLDGQRRYLRTRRLEWCLLALASAGGLIWATYDYPGWAFVSVTAMIGALGIRLFTDSEGAQASWYLGRAAAESFKTIVWRYAVGGEPFPKAVDDQTANALVIDRFASVSATTDSRFTAHEPGDLPITDWMRRSRSASFQDRKSLFGEKRLGEQRDWYRAKAEWNRQRSHRWGMALLVVEVAGILLATAMALSLVEIDPLGLVAMLGGGVLMWAELKNHSMLAQAYRLTADELDLIRASLDSQVDEDEWAAFVADAESAISREHTMWVASRRGN